ncbi:unnamed protein product [Closterium sp. NIES-53]
MATVTVLAFDAEGCPIDFESWPEDLHLYLQSVTKDNVSLFEPMPGSLKAPKTPWTARDTATTLAVRTHLSPDQRAHFRQVKSAQAFYDDVVKRYSSHSSATLGRLALPFLFPELSDFTTVADLMTLATMSHSNPASLDLALFETRLLEAETSARTVGASRGSPITSFFEGCTPSLLASFDASAAAIDFLGAEEVGTACAPSLRRIGRGGRRKGGGGGGGGGEL